MEVKTFYLGCVGGDRNADGGIRATFGETSEIPQQETILITDDDAGLRAYLTEMLRGLGYRVRATSDPDAALPSSFAAVSQPIDRHARRAGATLAKNLRARRGATPLHDFCRLRISAPAGMWCRARQRVALASPRRPFEPPGCLRGPTDRTAFGFTSRARLRLEGRAWAWTGRGRGHQWWVASFCQRSGRRTKSEPSGCSCRISFPDSAARVAILSGCAWFCLGLFAGYRTVDPGGCGQQ